MSRTIVLPGVGVVFEDGEREYQVPGGGIFKEDQPAGAFIDIHGDILGTSEVQGALNQIQGFFGDVSCTSNV